MFSKRFEQICIVYAVIYFLTTLLDRDAIYVLSPTRLVYGEWRRLQYIETTYFSSRVLCCWMALSTVSKAVVSAQSEEQQELPQTTQNKHRYDSYGTNWQWSGQHEPQIVEDIIKPHLCQILWSSVQKVPMRYNGITTWMVCTPLLSRRRKLNKLPLSSWWHAIKGDYPISSQSIPST